MQWFKNVKTATKLTIGFASIGAIMAGVGLLGIRNMGSINAGVQQVYEQHLLGIKAIAEARGRTHQIRGWILQHAIEHDPAKMDQLAAQIRDGYQFVYERIGQVERMPLTREEREALRAFRETTTAYRTYFTDDFLPTSTQHKKKEAYDLVLNRGRERYYAAVMAVGTLIDLTDRAAKRRYDEAQATYSHSRIVMLSLIVGGVIVGLILGYVIATLIGRALNRVITVTEQAAVGNFSARVGLPTEDDLGQMGKAIDQMLARLEDSVGQVMAVLAKGIRGDLTLRVCTTGEDRLAQMGAALNRVLDSVQDNIVQVQQAQSSLLIQAAALQAAANGIVICDLLGKVIWANPAFSRLTGYTAEEAVGRNLRLLKSGQHDEAVYRQLWETILAGQVWQGEIINKRKDGILYTEEQTIAPVRDERGEIIRFIAIKQDVTDRKQAEAVVQDLNIRLEERADRLHAVNRLSKVISSSLDLESIYQSFAREVKRLIPYDQMEVVVPDGADASLRVLQLAVDRPIHRVRIASRAERTDIQWMLTQSQPYLESDLAEAQQFREDEALLQAGIRSCVRLPLISKGQAIGILCMASVDPYRYGERELDLLVPLSEQLAIAIENARLYEAAKTATTALRSAQATLIETERLRAMGQMASGVAHDFNNILTGILGQVLLLQTRLAQGVVTSDELRRNLRLVERSALDGSDIVRKIREATRPRGEEPFTPVPLNKVVEQVLETTRPRWKDQAEAQGLRITVAQKVGDAPPVLGNAAELREALTNIFFNALDAMSQGGMVTIATRHVPVSEMSGAPAHGPWTRSLAPGLPNEREWVELAVTDTGIGMTPDVKARLFEPFFTTKGAHGTGLGLSMVQGVVRRHGGEIHITSAEGWGTSVIVRLPVAQAGHPELPVDAPVPRLPHRLRLLVIDDEPLLGETLADLLRLLDHEAIVATSGEMGLARLRAERFDLLITDLGMAGMSGWEVARASRAYCPELPVILVTGWGDQLEPAQLAGSGIDAVVAKPYTLQALLQGLSQAWVRAQGGRRPEACC